MATVKAIQKMAGVDPDAVDATVATALVVAASQVITVVGNTDFPVLPPYTFTPSSSFRLRFISSGAFSILIYGIYADSQETLVDTIVKNAGGTYYHTMMADDKISFRLSITLGAPDIHYFL